MNKQKGLSQILYLIIAAAVMMMVAMSLLFGFQGSFNDGGEASCRTSVQTLCSTAADGAKIDNVPSVCTDASGEPRDGITGLKTDDAEGLSPPYIDCSE
jgi:hypothetical protein